MQALVTNLAMIKGVKAINEEIKSDIDIEYWIIITWLSLILLGALFLTIEKLYRMPIFRKYGYSNTIKIMIFLSDIKSYGPVMSLCTVLLLTLCYVSLRSINLLIPKGCFFNKASINSSSDNIIL